MWEELSWKKYCIQSAIPGVSCIYLPKWTLYSSYLVREPDVESGMGQLGNANITTHIHMGLVWPSPYLVEFSLEAISCILDVIEKLAKGDV